MSYARLLVATACVTLLGACGGGGGGGGEGSAPSGDQVSIVFENTQFEDATVYIDSSTGTRRLGRVEGMSTGRFRVPFSPTGFAITASFTAIGEFETAHIDASAGTTVTVTAQSTGNLVFSIN